MNLSMCQIPARLMRPGVFFRATVLLRLNELAVLLRNVVVNPCIELETIEGNALFADWDFSEIGSYLNIETISIHAEVGGCVPQPQQARQQNDVGGRYRLHFGAI